MAFSLAHPHLPPPGTCEDLQLVCSFAFPQTLIKLPLTFLLCLLKYILLSRLGTQKGDLSFPSDMKHKTPWLTVRISEILCGL